MITAVLDTNQREAKKPTEVKEINKPVYTTVESGDKGIDDEALQEAVDAIDGFPFMLQLVGYRAWNATGIGDVIDIESIRRGIRLAQEELEHRVFDATLTELSKGDLAFLQAMTSRREGDGPRRPCKAPKAQFELYLNVQEAPT